jgi:hypothetical protein
MIKYISFAGGYEKKEKERKRRRRTLGIKRTVNITNDFRPQ